jgi:hypothetical protein
VSKERTGEHVTAESEDARLARIARGIRVVREGHGANCSSIGSVVDTLFATAVVGGVVLAAVAAALARDEVRVVGNRSEPAPEEKGETRKSETDDEASRDQEAPR